MNSPSRNPTDDHNPSCDTDELSSRLLDEETSADDVSMLSVEDRRRVADVQWLDALFEHLHGRNAAAVEKSVSMVLTRLRDEVEGPAPVPVSSRGRLRSTRRFRPLFIAATMLVLIAVFWWQNTSQSAYAMIDQAFQSALMPTDRTYRVTKAANASSAAHYSATLYLRGSKQFVYETTGPLGGKIWIGSNGREFWFIPPVGPVLVGEAEQFVVQWLNRSKTEMPFLQLTTILKRIRDNYDLTVLTDERLEANGPAFHRLHARRRQDSPADDARSPESIELWANHKTGVIQRLVLTRSDQRRALLAQIVTFDLTDESPLSEEFYDFSSRASDRAVVRVAN